jgi:hypothetical protein
MNTQVKSRLSVFVLAVAATALVIPVAAEATPYLKLTAPAKNAILPPLAQSVKFDYVIDIPGFRHFTHWNGVMGTWITVCTGGCSATADFIESHELTPAEQSSYTTTTAKIKQHLTQHNLPIGTPIKWNLQFHLPGTFYDPTEIQTDSTFTLGHFEAVGGVHLETKPTATATPKPANPPH